MDRDEAGRPARTQQRRQTRLVDLLLDSPTVVDRQARALLIELIEDVLGHRVFLREQSTAQLYAVEIVRYCTSTPGGLQALADALRLLEGETRTVEAFARAVGEGESEQRPEPRGESPQEDTTGRRDFFVSYTSADVDWAHWIAWELEDAGHTVLLQDWDFVAGSNWQFAMDRGLTDCERIIAVLSPAYLRSLYGRQEAHVAQGEDPTGVARRLVPVRVAPVTPSGLLGAVVYIDLVGLAPAEARTRLLDGVGGARSGRVKPVVAPRFPGAAGQTHLGPSPAAGTGP